MKNNMNLKPRERAFQQMTLEDKMIECSKIAKAETLNDCTKRLLQMALNVSLMNLYALSEDVESLLKENQELKAENEKLKMEKVMLGNYE